MSSQLSEIAAKPLVQVQSVKQLLMNDAARVQLATVAAKHMNPERMMRVVANAIRTTPKLSHCEPLSFLGALMQCIALGLEPNTVLGHAYLIPFDKTLNRGKPNETKITEVQVVIGYKGLIDLARRSGHITSIAAGIHYSDDELWDYEEGTESRLRHRQGPMAGKKQHAYAIAKFKDGGHAYVVLPWAHVLKIRDGSQGWKTAVRFGSTSTTPWGAHEDSMAKKTAIRALSNYLPLSVEFTEAITVDERKADYGAFAMNPTEGVMLDAEVDTAIDMQVEEEPEPEKAKPAPRKAAPKAAEPEKAKTEPMKDQADELQDETTETTPAEERKAASEADEKPAQASLLPEAEDYSKHNLTQALLKDARAMEKSDLLDLHGEILTGIKRKSEAHFDFIMEELGKIYA
jgi:recombination protein RecT